MCKEVFAPAPPNLTAVEHRFVRLRADGANSDLIDVDPYSQAGPDAWTAPWDA